MKKLLLAMGCFATILLNSSCTADSPVETNNENLTTPTKNFVPKTDVSADDNDDPIPPKTNVSTDDNDDPIPPKTTISTNGIDETTPTKN